PVGILAIGLAVECRHEVDAAFDQAPSQQETLPKPVLAVALTQPFRLLREIEQSMHLRRREQPKGAFSVDLAATRPARKLSAVKLPQQWRAAAQISGTIESGNAKMRVARVAIDLKAIIGAAEHAGRLSRQLHHVVQSVRQSYVRQDMGAGSEGEAD